ncbi:MAG TPA: hypothetical protein VLA09_00615, partial [Longimicrobiales bacterium]|nr:hypothetical protein [Longimicrobiales bacterium]
MRIRNARAPLLSAAAITGWCFLLAAMPANAQESSPTFSADVAPILQASCQECHRPEGIGPMSLVTYQETRRWASRIRDRVERRIMPPWHIDRTVGIQDFANDISLSDEEIG